MLVEKSDELPTSVRNMDRALTSLCEELKAINDYTQRTYVSGNERLRNTFEHIIMEEKEHAAMLISWICINDSSFKTALLKHLNEE